MVPVSVKAEPVSEYKPTVAVKEEHASGVEQKVSVKEETVSNQPWPFDDYKAMREKFMKNREQTGSKKPCDVKKERAEDRVFNSLPVEDGDFPEEPGWFLVGRTVVTALSTSRGRKLVDNEIVYFSYPTSIGIFNSIVRFSTKRFGEILGILDFGRDAWIHREDWIRNGIHIGSGRKYKDSYFLQAQAMCDINS